MNQERAEYLERRITSLVYRVRSLMEAEIGLKLVLAIAEVIALEQLRAEARGQEPESWQRTLTAHFIVQQHVVDLYRKKQLEAMN